MKTSKKAMICGILAAITLLAACDNSTSSGDSGTSTSENSVNPPSESTSSAETSYPTNDEVGITSSKPREIEGFEGNVKPVTPKAGDLIATFEIEEYGTIKAVLFPEAAPIGVENFQKLCDAGFYKGLKIHRVMKDFMIQGGSKTGDGASSKDAMVNGGEFGIETAQNARNFYGALCYANSGGMNSTQFYIVNKKTSNDIKTEFNAEVYKNQIGQGNLAIKQAEDEGDSTKAQTARQNVQYLQNQLDWVEGMTDEINKKYTEEGGVYYLDGNYTVFGQVYEGFDVLDAISKARVGDNGNKEISKPVVPIIIKNVTVTAYDGTEPTGDSDNSADSGNSTASEPADER